MHSKYVSYYSLDHVTLSQSRSYRNDHMTVLWIMYCAIKVSNIIRYLVKVTKVKPSLFSLTNRTYGSHIGYKSEHLDHTYVPWLVCLM